MHDSDMTLLLVNRLLLCQRAVTRGDSGAKIRIAPTSPNPFWIEADRGNRYFHAIEDLEKFLEGMEWAVAGGA